MSTTAGPVTVSLNGLDNVGKSTQLAWLLRAAPDAHLVGTVDRWDPRWQEVSVGDFGHWWFVGSTTAEHVELMMRSHVARRVGSRQWALEDRGLPMVLAACAATAAIKDSLSAREALGLVHRLATGLPAAQARREVHILLRRSDEPAKEARAALSREAGAVDDRYVTYQHALAEVLAIQTADRTYDMVLDVGDDPILAVQQQLRERLAGLGFAVQALPAADRLGRVWVLAGMSESGKSTVGELLRDEYGVTRLKIGYLLDIAALRAGKADPYQWPESEQAERLSEEILRLAGASKARTISIESAHQYGATAHLQRVWGNRCRVIYLDVDLRTRVDRAAETSIELRQRDDTKRQRGADRIREIADHVVDNSGPLSALKLALAKIVSTVDGSIVASDQRHATTNAAWLEQATAHLVDDQVALVLATGSTATAAWRPGWSDLDLLVVRDTAPASWLRRTVGALSKPDGVKVAVSVFTTQDVDALRVPARVLHSLRHATRGAGVLYRRPGYLLHEPSRAQADRAGRADLGLILMTTRRLLAEADLNVRAIYKHLVLLATILLHADGRDAGDSEAVLASFRQHHPSAGCTPPSLDALLCRANDVSLHAQLVQATDNVLAYLDRLDRTARTNS